MKFLGRTISKNFEKDIKKRSFTFGVVNQVLKDVVYQLLPFKICNHLFFCLKCIRMIGKCKLCSRIFIKDIEHVRKIESHFKVTNKSIEDTLVFTLMSETNAKSIVLNLYYLVDAFGLAENFSEQFVEIANKSFGIYILFLQIYCRVFFNALSDVTGHVTENYLLELEIKKNVGKVKHKIFGILLSCYCKTDAKLLSFFNFILDAPAFEHMFYTCTSGVDYSKDSSKILNLK